MKKLLIVLPFLFFTACPKCDDPTGPAMMLANTITMSWACKNPTQVQNDVESWCASKGICTMKAVHEKMSEQGYQGIIGPFICQLVVAALHDYAVSKVPVSWQCDPSKVGGNIVYALDALCELIPFEPKPTK